MHLTEWILMAFDFGNVLGCSMICLTPGSLLNGSGTLHLWSDKNMLKHFFEINAGFTIFLKIRT